VFASFRLPSPGMGNTSRWPVGFGGSPKPTSRRRQTIRPLRICATANPCPVAFGGRRLWRRFESPAHNSQTVRTTERSPDYQSALQHNAILRYRWPGAAHWPDRPVLETEAKIERKMACCFPRAALRLPWADAPQPRWGWSVCRLQSLVLLDPMPYAACSRLWFCNVSGSEALASGTNW